MKKIFGFFVVAIIIFLAGCSNVTEKPTENPTTVTPPTSVTAAPTTTEETVYYTVKYCDEDGNSIKEEKVEKGKSPSYAYDKKDTKEWDYSFDGWSLTLGGEVVTNLPVVTADITYYATISKVKNQYSITFESNGGSSVVSIKLDYGTEVNAPTKPTKDGFSFVSWCTDKALTTAITWPYVIEDNITLYASWNEKVDISQYLSALLKGYELNPYSYIPEEMQPNYSANLVTSASIVTDYSADFVSTSSIKGNGYGEQWHMVLDNLEQSKTFFNVLTVVEGLTTSSVAAFNNYLDSNPSDTSNYAFKSGIYNVTIKFEGNIIYYVLDYTASIGSLGEQSVQIALSMNIETKEKEVRIEIGEANALKYNIEENSYTFAIKYLGVRKAEFTISKGKDGNVEGHINEFLTVSGKGLSSAADFYITSEYASVVGNKAGGIIGFTGYISELYNVKTGKLLSYEVRETLSSITYNTLWFDLSYVSGITSIKYIEPASATESGTFYINGSTTPWAVKKVGGIGVKMLSRRFDIEMRTQYFYSYNSETESYDEVKATVPMLFVQEEYYSTLSSDVASVNTGVTLNITLESSYLSKVEDDYDTLVDIFIKNKEEITEEKIETYIGTKVTFK